MSNNQRERMYRMYGAVTRINDVYIQWSSTLGLSYYEMQLFYALIENQGPLTQKNLCDDLEAPKTTVNSIVKKFIKKGYLELEESPNSKKEKLVCLTPEGLAFAKEPMEKIMHIEEKLMENISDEQLDLLVEIEENFASELETELKLK